MRSVPSTPPVGDLRLVLRLLPFIRPHLGWLLLALALLPLVSAAQVFETYLIKLCLDVAIVPGHGNDLSMFIAGYFALLVAEALVRCSHGYLLQVAGQHVMYDVRLALFRRMVNAPLSYHDRNPTGKLLTRVTGDVEAINDLFGSGAVAILGDVITLTGIVGMMYWLDARLALMVWILLPVLVAALAWVRSRLVHYYDLTRTRLAAMNAYLAEMLAGMDVVKVSRREGRNLEEFDAINREFRDGYYAANYLEATLSAGVEFLSTLAVAGLVYLGGGAILLGTVTYGTLVAMLRYAEDLFRPLADMSAKFSVIQSALVAMAKIIEVLDAPVERTVPATAPTPGGPSGRVEFLGVDFEYVEGDPVFQDLTLTIEPGEKVAVVGATGAGKTSLAKLLTGLYPVQRGTILLDGHPLADWPLDELRRRVSYLPQDQYLFSGTVAANVSLGRPDIEESAITRALDRVGAGELVARLPGGVGYRLNERGSNLSLGERQLLSFARTLVLDPAVLILDEATSSLDPFLEEAVQKALRVITRDRTTLTIAHRLSTIRGSDRILVFHHGRLAEHGSHEELLGTGGIYRRLWELQTDAAASGGAPVGRGEPEPDALPGGG